MISDIFDMITIYNYDKYDKYLQELDYGHNKVYELIEKLELDSDLIDTFSKIISVSNQKAFEQGFKCCMDLITECKEPKKAAE